jgi:7,8-dihydropterin-6-yl-methyl-4-(beta-D-ribofuranosyl)aminobenzene 5'-phosphate synthase
MPGDGLNPPGPVIIKGEMQLTFVKITTLIDNSRGATGLANEWGLSLHVEANDHRLLFDSGASPAFAKNAEKLKVDLAKVDMAVLSHGHFDHGGGLGAFFSSNKTAPLCLRRTADGDHYGKFLFWTRYVGLDRRLLEANEERLSWVETDTEIGPGLHVLVSIPEDEPRPDTRKDLLVRTERGFSPDAFKHELVLVVKERDGVSVITGCGHLGVLNMVLAAKRKFPEAPIKAVIGGFHMVAAPITRTRAETLALALRFKQLGCQRIFSGHCTGRKALTVLGRELGDEFSELTTGSTFDV